MSKITIIIVNYRNWDDTIECLNSFNDISYTNYKIIVVDVANENNSVSELQKFINKKSNFFLLQLTDNKGFAYANNQGLKYAIAQFEQDFFLILNNDTTIEKNTLTEIVKAYEKINNDKIGFTSVKIVDYYEPKIIQTIGGTINLKTALIKQTAQNKIDNEHLIRTLTSNESMNTDFIKTDFVIGAFMFFRKELIDEIGFMPEEYFLYAEDIDWCVTATKKGFTNYVFPNIKIKHKQGKSTGNNESQKKINPFTYKLLYANYLKLFKKHFPAQVTKAYLLLIKKMLGRIVRLKFKEAGIIFKVVFEF